MFAPRTTIVSLLTRSVRLNRKLLSTEAKITTTNTSDVKKIEPKPVVAAPATTGGSSFSQRLSSFLAGCGVGFGLTYYFLLNELEESNQQLFRDISNIQKELNKGK